MTPRIAVHSPALAPGDSRPSGERTILAAALAALELAGFAPERIEGPRTLDTAGDAVAQGRLAREAADRARRLVARLAADPPALWYTYHCYHRCPDMIGPVVARGLGIPYVIQQPALSPGRTEGPWAAFARACREAVSRADLLLWATPRDLPALEDAGLRGRLVELPPALASLPPAPPPRGPADRPTLLTVAMMRPGDKMESYRRLAAALARLPGAWRLRVVGDGPGRAEVEALFAPFSGRVDCLGALGPEGVAAACAAADAFVWPGVGEGVGMAYLEAQAHGLPAVAEDHPAQGAIIENRRAAPGDPDAFAALIGETLADLPSRSRAARARVEARHGPGAAATVLRRELGALIAAG